MHYIAYVRLPRFYRDALTDPPTGPVVIHDGKRVLEVCEETIKLGVSPGFSFVEARTLAKGATFIVTEPRDRWESARKAWTQPLRRYTDRIEVEAPNAAYLDLSQHPDPYSLLQEIRAQLPNPCAIGIGRAKWLARRAAFRGGIHSDWVACPERMLAPLPVRVLPFESELTNRLKFLGCKTIRDVQILSLDTLRNQFGELAREVHLASMGLLTDRVTPNEGPPTLRCERQIEEAVIDEEGLSRLLYDLSAHLARQFAEQDSRTRVIRAWWEPKGSAELILPKPLRTATQIHLALAKSVRPSEPLTWILVEAELERASHHTQISFTDPRDRDAVSDALLRVKSAFGDQAIQCAAEVTVPRRVQVLKAWMGTVP